MASSLADELFTYVQKTHEGVQGKSFRRNEYWKLLEKLQGSLNVKLRPYQEEAVLWMLHRELSDPSESSTNGECFAFEGFNVVYPKGGILADEMGLGKTIEVLSCIICHPSDRPTEVKSESSTDRPLLVEAPGKSTVAPDETRMSDSEESNDIALKSRRRRKRSEIQVPDGSGSDSKKLKKSGINSEKYASLRVWYEQNLNPSKPPPVVPVNYCTTTPRLRCFCDLTKDTNDENVVRCDACGTEQHAECVGLPGGSEYFCPWCWTQRGRISSGGTLIVSPNSISNQWIDEINRHVNKSELKVLFYEGVKGRKYIQPKKLADYDIVITTYSVLQTELNYLSSEEPARKLRHAKKYHAPVSPLTLVEWWRLCLDEAQMVEGSTTKTATMACHLFSVHKWAVTGTPIQKSVHDLFGLVKFLNVEPFNNQRKWNILMDDVEESFRFLAPILWRNIKKDVFDQIGVPPQTTISHWLRFSPVESHFYHLIHTECAGLFQLKISRFEKPEEIRIKDMERTTLNSLLMPLLKLRQACIHPQVIRGKYVKVKHTMTMEELMMEMIATAKKDLTNALRAVVSSLNGIAGLNWLDSFYMEAVENYRRVLQIGKDYEHVVKIDTLQMIHTLHNLAEILESKGAGVPHTLRDAQLKDEVASLEEYYLKKTEEQVNLARNRTKTLSDLVESIAEGRTLSYSEWWEDTLRATVDDAELLNRITTWLEDNRIPGQTCLTMRVTSLPAALRVLATWLGDADVARIDALKSLHSLHTSSKEALSNAAVECHLAKKKSRRRKNQCQLCMSHNLLKTYETLIFSITVQDEADEELIESDGEEVNEKNKRLLADLKEVEIFKKKKEGSWKPSPQEGILRVIASYVKTKRIRETWVHDSSKHLLLLEVVKKEFKSLRAEWQKISNLVAAKDEIAMAKLRLRLPTYEEELDEQNSSSGLKKKREEHNINVIRPHEMPYHFTSLEGELKNSEIELKRTSGILLYLKNLQENGHNENEPCPVCQEKLVDKWSVLRCGHCLCFGCIRTLLTMNTYGVVECPMCRLITNKSEVSHVVNKSQESEDSNDVKLVGSYSTKVEAVTTQLLRLRANEPDVKVIIFSTWEKVLSIISDALRANSISFRRLETVKKLQKCLSEFKNGRVTALLLPLNLGAKGLNIVEATHVFLVEPILNPADELQAVGRVHRIGQTKPTFVHRFIIHDTVEEKMAISVDPDGWSDGNVTLSELFNLFRSEETVQQVISIDQ